MKAAMQLARTPLPMRLLETDSFFERMAKIQAEITRRAYELFASNGFTHGHDLEDWLRAESEILQNVPLEISETEKGFEVRAEVPGFTEREIETRVEPRRIYISAEHEGETDRKKGKTIYSERRSHRIARWFELPAEIDPDKVVATLSKGVLEMTLQKVRTAKKVPVEAAAA